MGKRAKKERQKRRAQQEAQVQVLKDVEDDVSLRESLDLLGAQRDVLIEMVSLKTYDSEMEDWCRRRRRRIDLRNGNVAERIELAGFDVEDLIFGTLYLFSQAPEPTLQNGLCFADWENLWKAFDQKPKTATCTIQNVIEKHLREKGNEFRCERIKKYGIEAVKLATEKLTPLVVKFQKKHGLGVAVPRTGSTLFGIRLLKQDIQPQFGRSNTFLMDLHPPPHQVLERGRTPNQN